MMGMSIQLFRVIPGRFLSSMDRSTDVWERGRLARNEREARTRLPSRHSFSRDLSVRRRLCGRVEHPSAADAPGSPHGHPPSRKLRRTRLAFCSAVLLCFAAPIVKSQQVSVAVRLFPDAAGRAVVEGSCAPANVWSFRDNYAGILGLGSRI